MWLSDVPPPPRRGDEEVLAEFGDPVVEFVPQPRLQLIGWGSTGMGGTLLEVTPSYWVADPTGDFHFTDTPMGPLGQIFDGHVHTEVPGTKTVADDPVRGALERHLSHHVVNYLINEPGFPVEIGSDGFHQTIGGWYREAETLEAFAGTLDVDGATHYGISLAYRGFTATAARIDSRIVTLAIRDAIADGFDLALRRRPRTP